MNFSYVQRRNLSMNLNFLSTTIRWSLLINCFLICYSKYFKYTVPRFHCHWSIFWKVCVACTLNCPILPCMGPVCSCKIGSQCCFRSFHPSNNWPASEFQNILLVLWWPEGCLLFGFSHSEFGCSGGNVSIVQESDLWLDKGSHHYACCHRNNCIDVWSCLLDILAWIPILWVLWHCWHIASHHPYTSTLPCSLSLCSRSPSNVDHHRRMSGRRKMFLVEVSRLLCLWRVWQRICWTLVELTLIWHT